MRLQLCVDVTKSFAHDSRELRGSWRMVQLTSARQHPLPIRRPIWFLGIFTSSQTPESRHHCILGQTPTYNLDKSNSSCITQQGVGINGMRCAKKILLVRSEEAVTSYEAFA
jgi:hypothetical protein